MYRAALEYLKAWKGKPNRKPLVIRGARQVGKSYLVRSFSQKCGYELFEINFEQDHDTADCFLSNRPGQILSLLELKHGQKIVPGKKPLFLDVGLLMSACGMTLRDIQTLWDTALVNSGALCEQFVGQHLLYRNPMFMAPELFYWCREKRQASSEIDYVISSGTTVIPVEVKAGTLKSLHVFVKEKKLKFGLRFNADMMPLASVPLHCLMSKERLTCFPFRSIWLKRQIDC